ncbi:ABC transporter substrate-binding protein [Aquabacterium sp. J223]|uniref:ABC transporter substrate-binding protein n=1 Tax=Aquabacterium sp. J223 TaxID=2898431 RepID=UPI0021AE2272|nr:ABC transporter substrate-binding protein [Aquabacterium sp. J223]UUX94787.1 ABC transporter substrate-binding protein [Aquabacterium sp. J223]
MNPRPSRPALPARPARRHLLRRLGAGMAAGLGLPALAASNVLRIAATVDLSGSEKANGGGTQLGAAAYLRAFNAAGGLNGTRLELLAADDGFNAEKAKANAQAFAADPSVIALLHPLGTRQTMAVMEAVPADLAIVGPNTGTSAVRQKSPPNVFWVRASYDDEVDKLVDTAVTLGRRRIGVVYPDDPLGKSVLAGFKAAMERRKLEPAVLATTPNTTSLEMAPAVQAVLKAAPEVVVLVLAGTAPAFVKAFHAAGGTSTLYGMSLGASSANIKAFGEHGRGMGLSIVVPSPFATKHELVRRYRADLQAHGVDDVSLFTLEGYVNARVLCEGLRRAGAAPTRASVVAALERLDGLDLGGMRIGYGGENRRGSRFVDVAVIGAGGRLLT